MKVKDFLKEKYDKDFNTKNLLDGLDALYQVELINLLEEYASEVVKQNALLAGVSNRLLKQTIETILHETYAAGNGGFAANFGLVTLRILLDYTGFDMKKRKCINGC